MDVGGCRVGSAVGAGVARQREGTGGGLAPQEVARFGAAGRVLAGCLRGAKRLKDYEKTRGRLAACFCACKALILRLNRELFTLFCDGKKAHSATV